MLFQMCYGPEIPVIYKTILKHPGCRKEELIRLFQYQQQGNIESLIDAVLKFLEELTLIQENSNGWFALIGDWNLVSLFKQLTLIGQTAANDSYNYMFATLYEKLFVQKHTLFIQDMHYHANLLFPNKGIGREKLNAWKRIMESFGLGYRVYSGFYALPHVSLMQQLLERGPNYDGALHTYCETYLHPILPCLSDGRVYDGMFFGLLELNRRGIVQMCLKQDLPSPSYGKEQKYNWLTICKGGNPLGPLYNT